MISRRIRMTMTNHFRLLPSLWLLCRECTVRVGDGRCSLASTPARSPAMTSVSCLTSTRALHSGSRSADFAPYLAFLRGFLAPHVYRQSSLAAAPRATFVPRLVTCHGGAQQHQAQRRVASVARTSRRGLALPCLAYSTLSLG